MPYCRLRAAPELFTRKDGLFTFDLLVYRHRRLRTRRCITRWRNATCVQVQVKVKAGVSSIVVHYRFCLPVGRFDIRPSVHDVLGGFLQHDADDASVRCKLLQGSKERNCTLDLRRRERFQRM